MLVAGAHTSAHQPTVLIEDEEGGVDGAAVVAVEERELLLPVRRVIGAVEVEDDRGQIGGETGDPSALVSALEPDDLARGGPCLQARERGLRGQRHAVGVASADDSEQRVVAQGRGVAGVLVARDDLKDALTDEGLGRVVDTPRIARIPELRGHVLGGAERPVHHAGEQPAPIAAGRGRVKGHVHRAHRVEVDAKGGHTVCRRHGRLQGRCCNP